MAASRGRRAFADAAAEAKCVVRRAGAGWNKHDEAAVDSVLGRAVQHGVPSVLVEYGGLRVRFDLVPKEVQLAGLRQERKPTAGSGGGDAETQMNLPDEAGSAARGAGDA